MNEGDTIYCHTSADSFFGGQMFTRGNYYTIERHLTSGNITLRTDTGTEAIVRLVNFTKNFTRDLQISSERYHMSKHKMI